MNKFLIIILPMFLSSGLIVYGGFYTLKAKAEETEKTLIKIEKSIEKSNENIEETEDELIENEKIDLEQSIIIKNIVQTLNKLNEKIDGQQVHTSNYTGLTRGNEE